MKIYITKPCPQTFTSRGFQYCTVWLGAKPVRTDIHIKDDNGNLLPKHQWREAIWVEGEGSLGYMPAKIFFKGKEKSPLSKDFWKQLTASYKVSPSDYEGREFDYYEAITERYLAGIPEGMLINTVIDHELDDVFGPKLNQQSIDNQLRDFFNAIENQKLGCQNVEKEGMSYHEWVVEYDIDINMSATHTAGQEDNNAWLTKSYTDTVFDLWLGKKHPPIFREAMIIDPAFESALKAEDCTSAKFNTSAHVAKFNVSAATPTLDKQLASLVAPTYQTTNIHNKYNQARDAFYQEHLAGAQSVNTEDDILAFYHHPIFSDVNAIELCGDKFEGAGFDEVSPSHLALMLLKVMAENHARQSIDTKGFAFKDYVKPISLDFIWNGHIC